MTSSSQPPLVMEIRDNSTEDGPGIRSVVFFKGCRLDCVWCQNPEGKSPEPELWFDDTRCMATDDCIGVCPEDALSRSNPLFIDRTRCTLCFECVEVCPSGALRRVGESLSVDEITSHVLRYKPFFDTSGGGVTVSGGEPALPVDFTGELLATLKSQQLHTLVETAGVFDLSHFAEAILPHLDMLYFDIKLIRPEEHRRYCRAHNEHILANFVSLHDWARTSELEILPRTPLIPGITDTEHNLAGIADFYREHGVAKAALLPNNPGWFDKLGSLGATAGPETNAAMHSLYPTEKLDEARRHFEDRGIEIQLG